MRSFVISSFALAAAVALAPSVAFAQPPAQQQQQQQQPPPGQPPAGQPPAGQQPAGQPPAQPEAPKISFTTPSGMLLVQVKADQTATFEEMMGKIQSGVAASSDPTLAAEKGAWKYYKAAEPAAAGNVMYVVVIDPAKPNTEYQFLEVLNKTLTDDQRRDPATQEMYKKYAAAIAAMNKLDLTPMGGGQ
jgi:hypothetical protein